MFKMNCKFSFPYFIIEICKKLKLNGFKAYIVGGALRDAIMQRPCKDFDITTDALPREIKTVFPDAKPYGSFGTMLLIRKGLKVEVTPFRDDAPGRKPNYTFGGSIYTDLARRDFTINSMAFDPLDNKFIDPFDGRRDIKSKIIRCTGSTKRLWEDPLRAMRAARFQAQLGFSIEPSTLYSLKANAFLLESISKERIRDELVKLVTGRHAYEGLGTLVLTDLMKYIIPELVEGMGVMHPNKPVDVLEHNLIACQSAKNTPYLRLAALLHDIGKPYCAIEKEKGLIFPDHHIKSADITLNTLKKLRFDKKTINKVYILVKYHMFYYTPKSPLSDARKLISEVGWNNVYDLVELRKADRLASGFKHPVEGGLKKLIYDLETLKKENSDYKTKDLAINGNDIIEHFKIKPGPQIGKLLEDLLCKVIENPKLNSKDTLLKLAKNFLDI